MKNIVNFNLNNKDMFILKKDIISVKICERYVEIAVNYNGSITKYNVEPNIYESLKDLYNNIKKQFSENEILLNYENWHEFFVIYNINGFTINYGVNNVALSLIFNESNVSTMTIKDNFIGNNRLSESYKIISQLINKIDCSTIKEQNEEIQNEEIQIANVTIESQNEVYNNIDSKCLTIVSLEDEETIKERRRSYFDNEPDSDDSYDDSDD